MQFFHVHVEITVIIICNFLLFDYKNIWGMSHAFLMSPSIALSFYKNLHFAGYLHSVGQTLDSKLSISMLFGN